MKPPAFPLRVGSTKTQDNLSRSEQIIGLIFSLKKITVFGHMIILMKSTKFWDKIVFNEK